MDQQTMFEGLTRALKGRRIKIISCRDLTVGKSVLPFWHLGKVFTVLDVQRYQDMDEEHIDNQCAREGDVFLHTVEPTGANALANAKEILDSGRPFGFWLSPAQFSTLELSDQHDLLVFDGESTLPHIFGHRIEMCVEVYPAEPS